MSRSLGVYLPTTLIYRLLGLVRGVILAWVLSATEFGLFQIALLATNVLIPLCSLGWYEGLTRYIPQHESRSSLRRFLGTAIPLALLISTVLVGAGWLLRVPLARMVFASHEGDALAAARSLKLTNEVLAAVWVAIAYLYLVGTLRGLRMFLAVSFVELTSNVALTLLALLCAWAISGQTEAMLVCYMVAYGLCVLSVGFMLLLTFRQSTKPGSNVEPRETSAIGMARQMWSFSIWMAWGAVVWQALQYVPVWYLHRLAGPGVAAVLVGVRLLTQAFHIVGVAIATVIQPAAARLWEDDHRTPAQAQIQLAFKLTCLVLFAAASLFVLAAPWILRMFPPSYAQGLPIMALSVVSGTVAGELFVLMTHFSLLERTHWQLLVWLVGLLATALIAALTLHTHASDAELLRATAWSAAGGMSIALATAWLLIRVEHRRWDAASVVLSLTPYAILLPALLWLLTALMLLVVTVYTHRILTPDERCTVSTRWEKIRCRLGRRNGPHGQPD